MYKRPNPGPVLLRDWIRIPPEVCQEFDNLTVVKHANVAVQLVHAELQNSLYWVSHN